MRLVLYTGKGGVGKTTTAAATALSSAALGKRTLLISADSSHSLADVLDRKIGPKPVSIAANLEAVEVDARAEMGRHWG
jgi:arsenite-transporting ATPase